MPALATAFVRLRVDGSQVGYDVRRHLGSSSVSAAGTQAGKDTGKRFGSGFASSLRGVLTGAVAAGIAFKGAEFFKGSISEASDLNETLNLTKRIFGENRREVLRWSKDSAESLGLSRNAALQLSGQFGDMFDQIGFGSGRAVDLSKKVLQLGADLGSFRNLDTADVLERIQAGFRGEYDSLQLLVPTINAAAVQSRALADTGKETAEQLTAQDKAAATLAIVFDKTKKAQGDFARTSDGLANSQKILRAEFDNVQARVGKALLPVVTDFVQFLRREGLPVLEDVATWLAEDGAEGIQDVAGYAQDLYHDLEPLIKASLPVLRDGLEDAADGAEVLAGFLGDMGGFVEDLPGPVKTLGLQIGAVALATKTLGLRFDTTAASGARMARIQGILRGIYSAARQAAGVAGVGLLIDSLDETENQGKLTLETIGGAAAIGFGIGGPTGAGLGAAAGSLAVFARAIKEGGANAEDATPLIGSYKDSLNQLTGAITRVTRAEVTRTLQEDGLLTQAKQLGINTHDLVSATLGQEGAYKRVTERINVLRGSVDNYQQSLVNQGLPLPEITARTSAYRDKIEELASSLQQNQNEVRAQQKAVREAAEAIRGTTVNTREYNEVLKALPAEAATQIRALGVDVTRRDILDIAESYKGIDKKELTAILKVLGLDQFKRDVNDAKEAANTALGGIKDEPVAITLSAQAQKVANTLDRFGGEPLAVGGPISGGIPGKDSVPGLLMPGEHVWTTDEVNKAGGHAALFQLRRLAKRGELPKLGDMSFFADGGPVLQGNFDRSSFTSALGSTETLVSALAARLSSVVSAAVSKVFTHLPVGGLGPDGTLSLAQIARGQEFAQAQVGKPYVLGGVGPAAYDCSGFVGAVLNAARGVNPYQRIGATGTMPWSGSKPGVGRYTIGWATAGNIAGSSLGHTAGNIGGLNVESYGGHGPAVGGGARSPLDGMFNGLMHYDSGGVLRPGVTLAVNKTGRNERVSTADQDASDSPFKTLKDMLRELRGLGKKSDRREQILGRIQSISDNIRTDARENLQSAKQSLRDLVSSQRQLSQSISGQFTSLPFGEGGASSARDLRVTARAQINDARLFSRVLHQLKRKGANTSLLRALAEAGPGAIVQAQALAGLSRKELNQYERSLRAGQRAADDIGDFIGDRVFGSRIKNARDKVDDLTDEMKDLNRNLDKIDERLERAVARAFDHVTLEVDGKKIEAVLIGRRDRRQRGG